MSHLVLLLHTLQIRHRQRKVLDRLHPKGLPDVDDQVPLLEQLIRLGPEMSSNSRFAGLGSC